MTLKTLSALLRAYLCLPHRHKNSTRKYSKMASIHSKKRNALKFLFWNARGLNKRFQELPGLLSDLDIFICVESWLRVDKDYKKKINYSGFYTFREDRLDSRGGGIAIMVRKNIAYVEITDIVSPDTSVELCGIRITNTVPSLDLIFCYRTPGSTLTQAQWDMVVNNVNNNNHCILVDDFNAHNQPWNCTRSDTNGERFNNSIHKHDLLVLNDNTKTHINIHSGAKSNLDLIISTLNIREKINLTVLDYLHGSDHFPVFLIYKLTKTFMQEKRLNSKPFALIGKNSPWSLTKNTTNFCLIITISFLLVRNMNIS